MARACPGPRYRGHRFAARDGHGRAITLGRNGSDYSAAIFANLAYADSLTIWTDVDGVLSADPRLIPDAVCLPSMSYAEACELAYFCAKVLHPQTLAPMQSLGIPLCIRNALRPQTPGTRIVATSDPHDVPVKVASEAHCIEQAVDGAISSGALTLDLAPAEQAMGTTAVTAAVLERLESRCYVAELRD